MNWHRFLGELQRRNVYRVAVTYTVVSWVLIQIATQVFPFFEIPTWAVRVVVLLLVLGFPVALIVAWAFELTPEGLKRTEDVLPHESIAHHTGRKLFAVAAIAAAIAVGLFLVSYARRSWTAGKQESSPSRDNGQVVPEKSIAVLPFSNLSTEAENAFFTDGIQEEILANLAKVADLKVISRSSAMLYKANEERNLREIGRRLGVAYLLEGSVQRTSDRVRVTAQLIDARTDAHQWGEHYDRGLSDVFAIQTEIAQAITRQLAAKLSAREKVALEPGTRDVRAFDLYLRAKELITTFHDTENWKETLLQAVSFLDEAISRDPNFALAYCWRTIAHDNLYWNGLDRTAARLDLAQVSVDRALALVPDMGEAHWAQALVYYHGKRDYTRAFQELALANRVLPNSAEVFYLAGVIARRQGRWEDSVTNLEKAYELDPLNPRNVNGLSVVYDLLRRYDDEVALFKRTAAANPSTRNYAQVIRAQIELERGDLAAARPLLASLPAEYDPNGQVTWTRITLALYERNIEAARKILESCNKDALAAGYGKELPLSYWQGMVARVSGEGTKATEAFTRARDAIAAQSAKQPDDPLWLGPLGLLDAGIGRKEEALREGRRAVELRPLTEDAVDGATALAYLAMIQAWVGNANDAIGHLEFLARIPNGPPFGQLKYDPVWDGLRGDPRFAAMLASLQPRGADTK
jgi:TolB-like protein/Tfp pilus assembly protein PilF